MLENKIFSPISKKLFEDIADKMQDTSYKMIKLLRYLKFIKSYINLKDEEVEIIKQATDIIINKLDTLEDDVLDNKNIEFYDPDKTEVEIE